MRDTRKALSAALLSLSVLHGGSASSAQLWWERGADRWYYKDDWKGLALQTQGGGQASGFTRTLEVAGGAASGWIVVWGDSGYRLLLNDRLVGSNVDGGLADDYDLSGFLKGGEESVTIEVRGSRVCAEGELRGHDGRVYPFRTGEDWQALGGGRLEARPMTVGPSAGAYSRAHNGRLMTYNAEEQGKSAIAKALARLQKLQDQGLLLTRRFRPAGEALSFDPTTPWRQAETAALPLMEKARAVITARAIPAQRAGSYAVALEGAAEASRLISAAEAPVHAAAGLYQRERETAHLENWAAMLADLGPTPASVRSAQPERAAAQRTPEQSGRQTRAAVEPRGGAPSVRLEGDLRELRRLASESREAFRREDWASVEKGLGRMDALARELRETLQTMASRVPGGLAGGIGQLDTFPEDRFGWLNARALMGNEPERLPFSLLPSDAFTLDLTGNWEFRADPDGVGEQQGWHKTGGEGPGQGGLAAGWRLLPVPDSWERHGTQQDNPKSPADAPYRLGDARTGDKPYNGFGWYRKRVFVPRGWQDRPITLTLGTVSNWARVFVNGQPLSSGQEAPKPAHPIPGNLLRFGDTNLIAVQVYNHDNFGGITGGPVALRAGAEPGSRETPGPLAFTLERQVATQRGDVRITTLASALSPGILVSTDAGRLELWGWRQRGFNQPTRVFWTGSRGLEERRLGDANTALVGEGEELRENWIALSGCSAEGEGPSCTGDTVVVLERRPRSLHWERTAAGGMSLTIEWDGGPARVALVALSPGSRSGPETWRFWARALQRYPVSVSEWASVAPGSRAAGSPQKLGGQASRPDGPRGRYRLHYRYLDLASFGDAKPLATAPVPLLFSFGQESRHPGLAVAGAADTGHRTPYAAYRVAAGTESLEYQAPAVDRERVMKGVGELFAKARPELNARGGVSEPEMFRRMGAWGFDHVRYAWAFHADWDLPLVQYMGGPILANNEAMWQRLDQLVEAGNANGLQMMLTWFFNEDSPQADTGGAVRNSTRYWRARPETQRNAFELWRRIAARYADRPDWAIAYDPFNEPAYMNTDHWNQVMAELTRVIRSVDRKHLIVWEAADGWAQPQWCLWMKPVKDDNVLYSFHHYGKHWGYAYDEYYPSTQSTTERTQIDPWLEALLFSIRENVPIHCGEFGISMIQPTGDGEAWLNDYLAFFERFGIGWNWWNYSGSDIYRTGLAAGERLSPYVPVLSRWAARSGWGAARRSQGPSGTARP